MTSTRDLLKKVSSETLVKLLTNIFLSAFEIVVRGYVFSVLWNWFIVPAFNLPAVSIPIAMGILVIIRYVSEFAVTAEKEEQRLAGLKRAFCQAMPPKNTRGAIEHLIMKKGSEAGGKSLSDEIQGVIGGVMGRVTGQTLICLLFGFIIRLFT